MGYSTSSFLESLSAPMETHTSPVDAANPLPGASEPEKTEQATVEDIMDPEKNPNFRPTYDEVQMVVNVTKEMFTEKHKDPTNPYAHLYAALWGNVLRMGEASVARDNKGHGIFALADTRHEPDYILKRALALELNIIEDWNLSRLGGLVPRNPDHDVENQLESFPIRLTATNLSKTEGFRFKLPSGDFRVSLMTDEQHLTEIDPAYIPEGQALVEAAGKLRHPKIRSSRKKPAVRRKKAGSFDSELSDPEDSPYHGSKYADRIARKRAREGLIRRSSRPSKRLLNISYDDVEADDEDNDVSQDREIVEDENTDDESVLSDLSDISDLARELEFLPQISYDSESELSSAPPDLDDDLSSVSESESDTESLVGLDAHMLDDDSDLDADNDPTGDFDGDADRNADDRHLEIVWFHPTPNQRIQI